MEGSLLPTTPPLWTLQKAVEMLTCGERSHQADALPPKFFTLLFPAE